MKTCQVSNSLLQHHLPSFFSKVLHLTYTSSWPCFCKLRDISVSNCTSGYRKSLPHLTGLSNSPACSPRCISYKDECACSVSAQELQTQISVPQAKGVEPALTSPLWGGSLQLTERRRVQDPLASALPRASCSCSQWGQKESFVSLTKHPGDVAFSFFSDSPCRASSLQAPHPDPHQQGQKACSCSAALTRLPSRTLPGREMFIFHFSLESSAGKSC